MPRNLQPVKEFRRRKPWMRPALCGAILLTSAQLSRPSPRWRLQTSRLRTTTSGKFVDWPHSRIRPRGPFTICRKTTSAESWICWSPTKPAVRGILAKRLPTIANADACQIVYIGLSEQSRMSKDLEALKDKPALTVSSLPGFLDHGGMIQFVLEQNRVRFALNLTSAHRLTLPRSALSSLKVALSRQLQACAGGETMNQPRPKSIAARLSLMNVLVSGIALSLAYISFLAYNLVSSRQAAIDNLTSEAQIIGANSGSAIVFNLPTSAQTTLSALGDSSDVVAGAIYDESGHLFAEYPATGTTPIQPQATPPGSAHASWKNGIDVLVATRIMVKGQPEGTVYIQAHLKNLRQQATHYAAITGAILLLCLFVALLVGSVFRKLLSEPIVSLARTARLVSRYRDYSLRFQLTQSYNELESLTEAFNEMLAEIQRRDVALEQARNELELRVEERTAQLLAANRELESFSYTVAHDLRGPLEIISNICYLLQNSDASASTGSTDPMLERLGISVADMSNIIDDLLNSSRAPTSAGLHRKQLDLSAIAVAILEDLATAHPERNVDTAVQLGCHADADKGLMQIVLQNLLRNAWKFTSRTQTVRIEFGCVDGTAEPVYYVRDNGAGFDQRMASRLFKPFQRLHAESDFGTGIGLATVQNHWTSWRKDLGGR